MKKLLSQIRTYCTEHWQLVMSYGLTFAFIIGTLFWKIGSLTPGYSNRERDTLAASHGIQTIWNNPLNAPYHFLVYLCSFLAPHSILATRLASTLIGLVTVVIFCALLYRWFGTQIAILGTILFGTTSSFLHAARLGVPEVMFLGIVALVGCGVWIQARRGGPAVILGLLLAGMLLYTPGMAWLIFFGIIWRWKSIDAAFKKHLGSVTIGGAIFFIGLAPLVWKLYKMPRILKDWLLIPVHWNNPFTFLHALIQIPESFFFRSPVDPETWLGRLPILSIIGIVFFLMGCYVFYKHFKLARVKLLLAMTVLGTLVIAVTQLAVPILVLVPFAYVVVTVGANYFLEQWLKVFPRNPLARFVGMSVFILLIGTLVFYNFRSYFIAWPQATITRNVFTVGGKQKS